LQKLSPEQQKMEREQMFQTLLADQFKVVLHRENKLLPAQVLVIAKNGPKIQAAKPGDTYPDGIKGRDGLPAGAHKFDLGLTELSSRLFPCHSWRTVGKLSEAISLVFLLTSRRTNGKV
jgi:uncharacterized protein (TIGR03435 family)